MEYQAEIVRNEKGVVIVYVVIALVVFLGFTALALDVGHLMVSRTELQRVADAAALAGARNLGHQYHGMPYQTQQTYVADVGAIGDAAKGVALQNQAGGSTTGIIINDDDIVIGCWDPRFIIYGHTGTDPLFVTTTSPDAVRVTARRDDTANGPIATFFARVLGINSMNVRPATATAHLSGPMSVDPGVLQLPVAINSSWMTTLPCNQDLKFHPSSDDVCAAWNTFDGSTYSPNANQMRTMVDAIRDFTYTAPGLEVGDMLDVNNGNIASLFTHSNIQDLFNQRRYMNDGVHDMDTNDATWTTVVAVFDDTEEGCAPTQDVPIVGFAAIVITGVDEPSASTIYATVMCDLVIPGRSGGNQFGPRGEIPGLVE